MRCYNIQIMQQINLQAQWNSDEYFNVKELRA